MLIKLAERLRVAISQYDSIIMCYLLGVAFHILTNLFEWLCQKSDIIEHHFQTM